MPRSLELVGLFHEPADFGTIRAVAAREVPDPARHLLDHRSHMTEAMERFHGGPVRLRVLATADRAGDAGRYAREILLESPAGEVVQFGIVRIELQAVDWDTARAIRAAERPLGRILIDAGLLREVHAVRLLEVTPGPDLARLFGPRPGRAAPLAVYGRVAEIQLNGRPAVELLEIVAPG